RSDFITGSDHRFIAGYYQSWSGSGALFYRPGGGLSAAGQYGVAEAAGPAPSDRHAGGIYAVFQRDVVAVIYYSAGHLATADAADLRIATAGRPGSGAVVITAATVSGVYFGRAGAGLVAADY